MFVNLTKLLCAVIGVNVSNMGRLLGYKTQSAFYKVISGKDIRLTVLLSICKACGCDIVITDHKSININLANYYEQQLNAQPEQGDE